MDAGEMKARMEAEKKAKDEALKRKSQAEIIAGVRRASSASVKPVPKPSLADLLEEQVPLGQARVIRKPGMRQNPFIPVREWHQLQHRHQSLLLNILLKKVIL